MESLLKNLKEQVTCAICLDTFTDPKTITLISLPLPYLSSDVTGGKMAAKFLAPSSSPSLRHLIAIIFVYLVLNFKIKYSSRRQERFYSSISTWKINISGSCSWTSSSNDCKTTRAKEEISLLVDQLLSERYFSFPDQQDKYKWWCSHQSWPSNSSI